MDTIVVGVDGSDGAAHALRWAVAEAERRGWAVHALLAHGFLDQHHALAAEGFDPHYTSTDAKTALDEYVEGALGGAAPDVERSVSSNLPARALLEASTDAQLLVVGARGLGGFRGLLLGSVSQRCLHDSTFPIAVIRPGVDDRTPGTFSRVVVGVDGSAGSTRALDWALDEARARGATLEVIHAWQPPYMGGFPFSTVVPDFAIYEEAARELMARLVEGLDATGLPQPVKATIECTGAAAALLHAEDRADLVVVGSRGLGGLKRWLLGSVSHQVTLHATSPVVVVPMAHTD